MDRQQILQWASDAAREQSNTETLSALGDSLLRAGQFDDAKATFEKLAASMEDVAGFALQLSITYDRLGETEKSRDWYDRGNAASLAAQPNQYVPASLPAEDWLRLNVWKAEADRHRCRPKEWGDPVDAVLNCCG